MAFIYIISDILEKKNMTKTKCEFIEDCKWALKEYSGNFICCTIFSLPEQS